MSKIIGARIIENKKIMGDDGQERVINKVEFRCVIRETATECIGQNVARYNCAIDELRQIFEKDPRDYRTITEYCSAMLDRECVLETKASAFQGVLSERLIHVMFLDELLQKEAQKK